MPGLALRAAAVNARHTGTKLTVNTRSGVDGGEHSATLENVMVVEAIHGSARSGLWSDVGADLVTTMRRTAHTSTAHTAANTADSSRTCHAARHDVNDPPYERWGHPPLVPPGSLTSWRAVSFPNSICFAGRHRAPPVGGCERANRLRGL